MRAVCLVALVSVSGCSPGLRAGADAEYLLFRARAGAWESYYFGTRGNFVSQESGPTLSFDLVVIDPGAPEAELAVWVRPQAGGAAELALGDTLALRVDGSEVAVPSAPGGRVSDMLNSPIPLYPAFRADIAREGRGGRLYLLPPSVVRQLESAGEIRFEVQVGEVDAEGELSPSNLAVVKRFLREPTVRRSWPSLTY